MKRCCATAVKVFGLADPGACRCEKATDISAFLDIHQCKIEKYAL